MASLPEYPTKDVLGEKCGLCDTTVGASPACSLPDIIATLAPSARASRPLRVHSAGVVLDSRIESSAIYVMRATIVTTFGAARG